MAEPDPVDTVSPWTIKAVAKNTRELVTNAARREGLTVGQWLERRVAEWEAAGSPVPVKTDTPPSEPARMHAASELLGNMGRAGVPVQKGVAALVNRLAKRELQEVLGAKPRKPPTAALPPPED
jgi:hypothetical protein